VKSAWRRLRSVRDSGAGLGCALAVALVLGSAAPAKADQGVLSYYLGVRAIGGYAMVDDVQTSGFTGTSQIQNDSDVVGGVGIFAGTKVRDWPVRFELEVAHRFRLDFDVRENRTGAVIDHEMNIATTSALVSAIVEWRNSTPFTPFLGASLGWARNATDVERINLATQVKTERSEDRDNLAWGAMVGVDWDFSESWTAQAAYRYVDLGEVGSGAGPSGESISADSHTSHDLLLGVLYRF
jgi:opacity protein-like surface antigen